MVKIVKKRVNSNLGRLCGFCQKIRLFPKVRLCGTTRRVSLQLSGAGPGGVLAMKNADGGLSERSDGAPLRLHPWLWMLLALLLTGVCFVWARVTRDDEIPLDIVQLPLLVTGVIAAGVAVWMRCADPKSASLEDLPTAQRGLATLTIAVTHAALAVAVTMLVAAKFLRRCRQQAAGPPWSGRSSFGCWWYRGPASPHGGCSRPSWAANKQNHTNPKRQRGPTAALAGASGWHRFSPRKP